MMNFPELIRNIAIVGHLHHGKTSFVDMLVNETHSSVAWDVDRQVLKFVNYLYTEISNKLI
jgi:116 kDa U5 small nuclear ribonucleoprotein component